MNGSTSNGVVGFNLEGAQRTADRLNGSFNEFYNLIDNAMYALADIIFFNGEAGMGSNLSNTGWYAPEAVTFEKTVFEPTYSELFNDMHNLYTDIYEKVESSIIKWAQTTGAGAVRVTRYDRTISKGSRRTYPTAKMADPNNNIRISPALGRAINKQMKDILNSYNAGRAEVINQLRGNEAYLGAGQQASLIANVSKMLDKVEKRITETYEKAAAEVNKSIDKYQRIARQIANSFNKTN